MMFLHLISLLIAGSSYVVAPEERLIGSRKPRVSAVRTLCRAGAGVT